MPPAEGRCTTCAYYPYADTAGMPSVLPTTWTTMAATVPSPTTPMRTAGVEGSYATPSPS